MEETSTVFAVIVLKLALSLAVVAVALVAYRLIRSATKRTIEDATQQQRARVALRNLVAIVGFLLVALICCPREPTWQLLWVSWERAWPLRRKKRLAPWPRVCTSPLVTYTASAIACGWGTS
jgi:hypothetical protein